MPAISASAPGKVILLGEHAVVYGRPALAAPLFQVQARVVLQAQPLAPAGSIAIASRETGLDARLEDLAQDHPLALALRLAQSELGGPLPACQIRISSSIPVAAGLGSGAAVSVALLRAVSAFAGAPFPAETVNRLAFEVEKLHHGTPSGIDNTVITYARPVYYKKGLPPETLSPGGRFAFLIANTGIPSPTAAAVAGVRLAWQASPPFYEDLFNQVGELVDAARAAVEKGDSQSLGASMNHNQDLLERMGVSSRELERLISAARQYGALGAKLSGAGRGGNMIALVDGAAAAAVEEALLAAGAAQILHTEIS